MTDTQSSTQSFNEWHRTADRIGAEDAWDHQQAIIDQRDAKIAVQKEYIAELEQRPEVCWEDDGEIQIEWYKDPTHVLSLSIGPRGNVSWSGLWGEEAKNDGVMSADLFTSISRFVPPEQE